MTTKRALPRWVKLALELLENRDAPSVTPWTTLSFEGSQVGSLPVNWSQWNSDGSTHFAVTGSPTPALSGKQSFSATSGAKGASGDASRAWLDQTMPASVQVSAAVYVNSLIPAQVIARGSNLDAPDGPNGPSFYAVELSSGSPGPKLALVKDVNGTETALASINAPVWMNDVWLQETLDVEGSTVRAQLYNPNTGEYLNSSGQWQSSQTWALTVIDDSVSGPGVVGLGRAASYTGTIAFDDFSVFTPASDQSFDATPVGSLPDNWSQWGTNGGNFVAVATPTSLTPPSAPNALAITPAASGDTARSWLNTILPADLSVSADTYANVLTPAQVFARGSDLNSSTPSYYAVEVSRGLTVSLVKVVNGVQTSLASVSSAGYVQNVWVQETLGLSGNTLEAQIYRTDTQQYLNSSGHWQNTPTWAVTATDNSITGGGQTGVARPIVQEYRDTNYFDEFTTAVGTDAQSFDSSTALPAGWQQWSSNGKSNYFTVASAPNNNSLSAGKVLESTGVGSTITAQIWDANESLTNAQVSTGLYLTTPMPTVQLIARATALGTSAPSYYGLSVTASNTGPVVTLVRDNGGITTTLAQLSPTPEEVTTNYISNKWIQETLYVDGASIRAQVYRADTGQYLNDEDLWQATPTFALDVTDTTPQSLTAAGYAGLLRSNSSGTIYLDNFAVTPLSEENTPPTVSVSAPSGTLSGVVPISATVAGSIGGVSKVDFYVDGTLSWEETAAPYTWDFDTSFVSNGMHTLQVMAYDAAGNVGFASINVTTSNNTALTSLSFPNNQNSVGIAELAYQGHDGAPYDNTLLENNVNVVVPDPSFLSAIHSANPNVQQLIYTNVSNVYGGELTSWLNYAEENGVNPEQAFYHASIATPFSYKDGTESTQPVDWFWGVYAYQNGNWQPNLTAAAHSGSNNAVPFGSFSTGSAVGDTLNVGYTDPFAEMDINLSQARSGGSYILEYPSAVDSNGNPTTWSTLTNLSDTTKGLTTSGSITFDPPSNWVPAVVDGSANNSTRYYYVRFLTTSPFTTIPVAKTILGANYTQATDTGTTTSGVIPAYDWALDPQGGYLNAQQYAIAVAAGDTARFGYQSRLFYGGQMRYYTNPSSPAFQAWAVQYNVNVLNSYPAADTNGLFVDNSENNPPDNYSGFSLAPGIGNFNLVEPTITYSEDYASLLNEIDRAIAPKWILANIDGTLSVPGTNNGQTYADPVISKVQAYYEEFGIRALAQNYQQFTTLYNLTNYRTINDSPSYAVLDSTSGGGSETDPRTQMATLAAYYLLAPNNPSQGALDFYGGESPWSYWAVPKTNPTEYQHWTPAAAYNIGTPSNTSANPLTVFATGKDPENSNLTYYVYERSYTEANGQSVLVLYKPLSSNGSRSGTTDDATATTFALNGSYCLLLTDGTLSSTPQTTVTLRNGEGAILVQEETNGVS